jgi:hypothetical protein
MPVCSRSWFCIHKWRINKRIDRRVMSAKRSDSIDGLASTSMSTPTMIVEVQSYMRSVAILLTVCALLVCTSCVPSLNPIYTEQDLIFDSSLIGVWADKYTDETWALAICDRQLEYILTHIDPSGKKGEFSARLVQVDDKTFFDIVPVNPGFKQNDFYQGHFFSTHTFAHIVKDGSSVRLSVLEPHWLKEAVAVNPDAIRHQKIRGEIVLTSSPKETQKFLLANLNNREAFSEPVELTRKGHSR